MRLKMVQTATAVYTPNGGGSTAHFLREGAFDMVLEGGFIRIRQKGNREGAIYSIPMSNVAIIEQYETRSPFGDEPITAKEGKK